VTPRPASCNGASERKEDHMDLLWIIIIVLVVLALLGYFGFGRRRGL
jgi:flagellar basal body-associated protein FliL